MASSENGRSSGSSSSQPPDGGGHHSRSGQHSSSLQTRAHFLKNWDWVAITAINRSICARSGAAFGLSSETGATCGEKWEKFRLQEASVLKTLTFLRDCHKEAPFLNFNGNTFGAIGSDLVGALYGADPYKAFQNVITSVGVHLIANKISPEEMDRELARVESSLSLSVGDRVTYVNGRKCGVVSKILPDGRMQINPGEGSIPIIASPGTVLKGSTIAISPQKSSGVRIT